MMLGIIQLKWIYYTLLHVEQDVVCFKTSLQLQKRYVTCHLFQECNIEAPKFHGSDSK